MDIKHKDMRVPEQSYFFKYRDWNTIPKSIVDSVVKEVLVVAQKELNKSIKKLVVLDVGCGAGEYSFALERYAKKIVGVEPFKPTYDLAIQNKKRKKSRVIFVNTPIENFQSKTKFDLVISLTTIEHMSNAEKSFKKIFSLMNEGGVIYLTAPNKWWPPESHYKLLFLSWLPLPLANLYLRVTKRGYSYEDSAYSKSFFGMRAFFNKFPCEYKFTLPNDPNLSYIGCGSKSFHYNIMKNLGIFLIKISPFFWIFSKGFIMVIKKI